MLDSSVFTIGQFMCLYKACEAYGRKADTMGREEGKRCHSASSQGWAVPSTAACSCWTRVGGTGMAASGGRCAMAAERIGNSKLLFAAPSGRLPPPAAAPRARRGRRLQRPAVACRSGSQRGGARPGQVVRMREADVSGVPSATTSGRPVGEPGGERSHWPLGL